MGFWSISLLAGGPNWEVPFTPVGQECDELRLALQNARKDGRRLDEFRTQEQWNTGATCTAFRVGLMRDEKSIEPYNHRVSFNHF